MYLQIKVKSLILSHLIHYYLQQELTVLIYAVLCIQAMQLTHPYGLVVTIWPTQEIGLGQQASNKLKIMQFNALFCQLVMSQLFLPQHLFLKKCFITKTYQLNLNVLYFIGKPIEGYLNFESDPNYIDANGGECLDLILDGNFQWRKSQCSSKNVSHAFIAEKGKGTKGCKSYDSSFFSFIFHNFQQGHHGRFQAGKAAILQALQQPALPPPHPILKNPGKAAALPALHPWQLCLVDAEDGFLILGKNSS